MDRDHTGSPYTPMTDPVDPHQNQLLDSLPAQEWLGWQPELERVEMPLGKVFHESGVPLRYVYFPINAIVSLLYGLENGSSAETAVVGREGVVGISIFMGGGSSSTRAVVQSAGIGYRMRADGIKSAFERSIPVMHLMLRFTQALITQMSQTAVCNRHHSVDQQLCRWLLISLDRGAGDELVMTHHLISDMLGVRREVVTAAARKLQESGLIRYARGRIKVLNRPGLEQRVCACYRVVKKEDKWGQCVGRLVSARSGLRALAKATVQRWR
jgi:CRP-like cAMP-binding protein